MSEAGLSLGGRPAVKLFSELRTTEHPVLLATSSAFADLTEDDQLLQAALLARGIDARPAVWDQRSVAWESAALVVLRSVWDYHLRLAEFLAWLGQVEPLVTVLNPPALVRWNAHKSYLRELGRAGIPVIETEWFSGGTGVTPPRADPDGVRARCQARGWNDVLVKPAVGASAHATRRFVDLAEAERFTAEVRVSGDVMVQPYLPEVAAQGERSFVFVAGAHTHTVQRTSTLVTGIVAADRGTPVAPRREELALAHTVLARIPSERPPLYARVDLVETRSRGWLLLELELIEPTLFLAHCSGAVAAMADAVANIILPSSDGARPG